jgi:uncharacterized SAM-binding protein YcdF (DUF218 family)
VFLFLSKTLDLLLSPLVWALLLLAAALLLRRRGRLAWALVGLAGAVLVAFSADRVADRLIAHAESRATRTFRPGETYDAVIVLAGMVEGASRQDGGRLGLASEGDRIVRAFELLREGRARYALLSGGFVDPRPGEPSEAEVLAEMLRTWGIEPERIAVEGRSRNTRENAVESARIVAERGWKRLLLVTSAAHMPRALGCFRQAGLRPDTLPVDYRVGLRWGGVMPRAKALSQSTDAIRELAGRLVYRVMGYTAD